MKVLQFFPPSVSHYMNMNLFRIPLHISCERAFEILNRNSFTGCLLAADLKLFNRIREKFLLTQL